MKVTERKSAGFGRGSSVHTQVIMPLAKSAALQLKNMPPARFEEIVNCFLDQLSQAEINQLVEELARIIAERRKQ